MVSQVNVRRNGDIGSLERQIRKVVYPWQIPPEFLMRGDGTHIATLELRRLLFELKDIRPDICIRFRLIGEMWRTNFYRVIKLTDEGAIFMEEETMKLLLIRDLRTIIQFEIDKAFQDFQPHHHYNVDPLIVDLKVRTA